MKKYSAILLAAGLLATSGSAALAATDGPSVSVDDAEMAPNAWFVQLKSKPAKTAAEKAALNAERQAFRNAAASAGVSMKERYSFDTLWNGVSVDASADNARKIRSLDGVTGVWPVLVIDAPDQPLQGSPELFTAISMTGADIAQNELGFTGAGVKVAVMDTGIDVDHADFGGDGVARNDSPLFPSTRIAYGYDFVGDDFNADPTSATYNPVTTPDNNPDDCGGHGTHVAGIVGANGVVKGVAPEVTFGAYRVFGCNGSTTADIMIAAMERAYADGMDILNMSIGSAYQWPQYPTAVAASNLVDRGMVVVTSIGNSGANGLYSASAPGLGEKVIGTASFDNTHSALPTFTVSPDATSIGYGPATGAPLPPTSGTFPITRTGTAASTADACSPLLAGSLNGQVALVRRGGCSFHIKSDNAQNAGAIAVVLYNSGAGRFNPTVVGPAPINVPVVAISDTEGVLIDGRLAAGPVDMTWTDQTGSFVSPTGGLISSFSSYGLSPDLALKPDIGAPGGNIYSTIPLEQGVHGNNSGTSMASPHVAGAAALVLEARSDANASNMRDILQNSADPKNWWGNPGLGFLDVVHRQGAGMVDVDDSILAETLVQPGKISAGEGEAGPFAQTLTLSNKGSSAVTYDLSSVNALSTSGVITAGFSTSNATVAFSAPSVTVPAGGSASVVATINPATSPVNGQYGGYIVMTPQGGGQVYRVPFAGFVGDYQGIQVLTPTGNGFPWLARASGTSYAKVDGSFPWVYTLQGGDVPYFLVHLDHQSEYMEAIVYNAKNGKPVHPVFNKGFIDAYLPRNSTTTGFFALEWDATRIHSNGYNGKGYTKNMTKPLEDGEYFVEIRILKANGDSSNPAHWESWTSPTIAIDRP